MKLRPLEILIIFLITFGLVGGIYGTVYYISKTTCTAKNGHLSSILTGQVCISDDGRIIE